MDINRLEGTAQSLLAKCFPAADPVACLLAELDQLWATGQWSEAELRQLQEEVLPAVEAFIGDASDDAA
ncbi:MAG: hypothetical protein WD894_13525 [Pirellulales bacterium]